MCWRNGSLNLESDFMVEIGSVKVVMSDRVIGLVVVDKDA